MSGINSVSFYWLRRRVAGILVLALVAPLAHAVAVPHSSQDQTAQTQQSASDASQSTAKPALPNEPQNHSQNAGSQQQAPARIPVGTAAAPLETPVGTAVSRPAGAAIAPAKQKRSHTLLIRVGLVIGAAVAVGTVVGLSRASRSRP